MSSLTAWVEYKGDVTIVQFQGRVDYESANYIRTVIPKRFGGQKLVFDLGELAFVGSVGLMSFASALSELANSHPERIKFSRVGIDFKRVLLSTEEGAKIEFFDSPTAAAQACHFRGDASRALDL